MATMAKNTKSSTTVVLSLSQSEGRGLGAGLIGGKTMSLEQPQYSFPPSTILSKWASPCSLYLTLRKRVQSLESCRALRPHIYSLRKASFIWWWMIQQTKAAERYIVFVGHRMEPKAF
jgi:hypothetical protein